MVELYQAAISGPVLPATILLVLLLLWSISTIVLGVGSDLTLGDWFPGEPSLGPDTDGTWQTVQHTVGDALGGVVLTPAKWLNLKDLPIVVWGGVFTLVWWSVSITNWYCCDPYFFGEDPGFGWNAVILIRNIAIALLVTKLITQPMKDWFINHELKAVDLVGQEVIIASYDASPTHGQAKYKTDSAPLLLNVKTDGPILPKGTRAWIAHYDPKTRIYIVSATTTTTSISSH